LSRNLKLMAENDWVVTDGGVLGLTSAGERLIEKLFPAWEAVQKELKAQLGPKALPALDAMAAGIKGA
jgi:hypothetical protein